MEDERSRLIQKIEKQDKRNEKLIGKINKVQDELVDNKQLLLDVEMRIARLRNPGYFLPPAIEFDGLLRSIPSSSVDPTKSNFIPSKHIQQLTHIDFSPVNPNLFFTGSSDGVVKFWEYQPERSGARELIVLPTAIYSKGASDIAFNPDGNSLVCVFKGEGFDFQVSVFPVELTYDPPSSEDDGPIITQGDAPHDGGVKCVSFLSEDVFVTAGAKDKCIAIWKHTEDDIWDPHLVVDEKYNLPDLLWHSGNIMDVCCLKEEKVALSVSRDTRLCGFDCSTLQKTISYDFNAQALGITANPVNPNVVCVYTNPSPDRYRTQLRLYDYRINQEVGRFRWTPLKEVERTSFVKQDWSPNGLLISSGSTDSQIHVFDIRARSYDPCKTIEAHGHKVIKAVFHRDNPLLISISPDNYMGIHHMSSGAVEGSGAEGSSGVAGSSVALED